MKSTCSHSVPLAQRTRAEYCGSDRLKPEDDSSELKKKIKKGSEAKTMSWMVTHLDAVFTPERKSAEKLDCDVIHPWRLRFCFFKVVLHVADDHIFWVASSLMDNCTLLMRLILPNWFMNAEWLGTATEILHSRPKFTKIELFVWGTNLSHKADAGSDPWVSAPAGCEKNVQLPLHTYVQPSAQLLRIGTIMSQPYSSKWSEGAHRGCCAHHKHTQKHTRARSVSSFLCGSISGCCECRMNGGASNPAARYRRTGIAGIAANCSFRFAPCLPAPHHHHHHPCVSEINVINAGGLTLKKKKPTTSKQNIDCVSTNRTLKRAWSSGPNKRISCRAATAIFPFTC